MRSNFVWFLRALVILWMVIPTSLFAQTVTIKGRITDSNTGDGIPFVNVIFKGTTIGTTTDFDGMYTIKTSTPGDSLSVSYIGYHSRVKAVSKEPNQVINFQLEEEATALKEVVIYAGENPAYEILRKVVRNKNHNDKRKLSAYEYDTYTKIEIDVDNISDKLREKKVMRKIAQVLDSVERIAGEDGKPILPMFISESVSKFYYRTNPQLKHEKILKTKISGVGVEDGTVITQVVGSSFQEYNFYQNWLNILGKDFVSPIADGWRLYYEYDLTDSVYVGDDYCYRLDFFPRSPQDLAFSGTAWITKNDYALKQIDVTVGKQANLNFVDKIKIQQELQKVEGGAWLPVKNRVMIDVGELSKTSAGMLAKFYTSNKNFQVNTPKETSFYKLPIITAEDARMNEEEEYWDELRHEPLTETEKNVYKMIDTLQNIPVVKTYIDIIKIAVDGYYRAGKVDIGPYVSLFSYNTIEEVRLQSGFRTNIKFSDKWILRGQLGYGFGDQKFKYLGSVERILSRDRWTVASFRYRRDLGRVGVDDELLANNLVFLAAQRWGNIRTGYYFDEARFNIQRELFKGFTQRLTFKHLTFDPTFDFGYVPTESPGEIFSSFKTSEVIVESRFARDELFIQNDNERVSLGTSRWPVITARFTRGFKDFMGSDFDYSKVRLSILKRVRSGPLGTGYVNLSGEYTIGTIPYPLLSPHIGNQTPFYTTAAFNLMDYSEFVSDRYAALQYQHHFEGFILNRIPLMKKLKWRLVGSANVIMGDMSEKNKAMIAQGEDYRPVGFFDRNKPYVELGYGVENIFKFFRIDFVHRMSYIKDRDARNFGVLCSFQFTL
jgi:hypothetical protein